MKPSFEMPNENSSKAIDRDHSVDYLPEEDRQVDILRSLINYSEADNEAHNGGHEDHAHAYFENYESQFF